MSFRWREMGEGLYSILDELMTTESRRGLASNHVFSFAVVLKERTRKGLLASEHGMHGVLGVCGLGLLFEGGLTSFPWTWAYLVEVELRRVLFASGLKGRGGG